MKIHKIALITLITLLITIGQAPINHSSIVGITQVLAQTSQVRKAEADRLYKQGIQQFQTSQFEAAIQSWQQALIIYQEIKDRKSEGNTLTNIGAVYGAMGDYPKFIEYQQQSLAIAREMKDRLGEGYSLGNIGLAYFRLGDYNKAIDYLQQTLAIARELKDRKGEGNSLNNLGNAYGALGDYPKAIEYYQQSLAIKREINDQLGEANSLGNLGNAYNALGDYSKAIEYQQERLTISRAIKDKLGEAKALGNLGNVYNALGDYLKAIEYHSSSLAIAREIKDRSGEGATLGELGLAYNALGDYKKAIEYHSSSLAIARELKDRESEVAALGNLGNVYDALEDYPKAIEYHSSSLAIARELKDRNSESRSLGNLGNVYDALGNYKKAIEYHQQSLAIARETKYRLGEGKSLVNLGNSFYKSDNLSAAERSLYEGIKVLESLRDKKLDDTDKISLFDAQSSIYRDLQQVLIAQNKTDAALEIAERGRARAFVELLATRVSTNNKQADKSPEPPTIAEIKQISKQQNVTFVQYSMIYEEFKVAGKQQFKESDLYIWLVKPTGEVTFRKVDIKHLWQKDNTTLDELVFKTRDSLGVVDDDRSIFESQFNNPNNEKAQRENLQKLHQILIKPIADLLPNDPNQRVTFVPQSSLFLVPFPALMDEQGKSLIEKHTILTAPAIQVLDFTHQLNQGKTTNYNNALIVGNPNMPVVSTEPGQPATKLKPLPGAEKEAKTIADMLKTKAILGKDATKANILQRLSTADVIHLATHGWADDNRGLGSWIALAPSGKDDGLLTAEEILDLKLKAQLVVLSACETGKGKLSGDGVIGLSRSLISAGVPSVLVSLWQVPDEPTQYLMVEFYQSLQTQPDKALALRQAMLKTKEKFPSPVNWAAFTLIGER
ncbi:MULTISPECIES: CHAT domain-containing protein [Calothrix]|uniref:Tetratricopeptide repeat protein n=2 Tax=Calothrix TaxID=1186 RepID=A0ABR8ACG5_9CYAN|nr:MULTISPECIES: CHAT domain-containing tetratricopeptide repeat protein [Calothrix]MBD2197641.1 tetratricopeptide repeat protein [Calothrix parietina FACHB-288]MBD2229508.1 tetratricopeptide repeat protein [Calothrix anomala FACHB-343]